MAGDRRVRKEFFKNIYFPNSKHCRIPPLNKTKITILKMWYQKRNSTNPLNVCAEKHALNQTLQILWPICCNINEIL